MDGIECGIRAKLRRAIGSIVLVMITAAGIRRGNVDTVLVNIQSDVQGARFLHGPCPCKFATTRPTIGPVHWCSSARLGAQPTVLLGTGRLKLRSHLV